MSSEIKNQAEILSKLGIEALNAMQLEAEETINSGANVVLLSPTGTGKTLAFLLPLIQKLDPEIEHVQALILAPSRELALQIEQVLKDMGTGLKTNAVYGGRPMTQDRIDLKQAPAILIGTPGRVADHLRKGSVLPDYISHLILDEFDKSLEIGFESEMREIIETLQDVKQRILTSATQEIDVPDFVKLSEPKVLNYLNEGIQKLAVKIIDSEFKDKLPALVMLLKHLGPQPGIVFCNFKESINRVSEYLLEHGISHGIFYGGMEQKDRERALIKFRNGTHNILLATDLAARGLDVPEMKFIIHYHLPLKSQEFTHRNGRTARMHCDGTAYVLAYRKENLPDFIEKLNAETIDSATLIPSTEEAAKEWCTLFISGGRRDKISKGDIAGMFFKQGKLKNEQLGVIELKPDCAFVSVEKKGVNQLIKLVDNARLKSKKVRITRV
ncbi:MAG: DEAD/DEAH box helicase [Salibacteraceae bacterium]|nr:DEAD/DEAH box helicase [Salibacteraceae bacterium]